MAREDREELSAAFSKSPAPYRPLHLIEVPGCQLSILYILPQAFLYGYSFKK